MKDGQLNRCHIPGQSIGVFPVMRQFLENQSFQLYEAYYSKKEITIEFHLNFQGIFRSFSNGSEEIQEVY